MKKIFLLVVTILIVHTIFAQRTHSVANPINTANTGNRLERTTAIGDTEELSNITSSDTLTIYSLGTNGDSGYVTGTDAYGDEGFAERYVINGNDSSVVVLGVMAQFAGTVNPTSSKTVVFKAWTQGIPEIISSSLVYDGFPDYLFDSIAVPVTQLGIGDTDTIKIFLFPQVTYYPDSTIFNVCFNFYLGYTISYNFNALNGDTLGLATSLNGERTAPAYTLYSYYDSTLADTVRDTTIYVQNCTQWSDNTWHDNYSDNDSLFNDLAIYPIVRIDTPTLLKGVTRRSITLFGLFPNPASSVTNVQFGIAATSDVTVQVLDMSGKIESTTLFKEMAPGNHTEPLSIDNLPAGTYTCLVRTTTGDGIATLLTVRK